MIKVNSLYSLENISDCYSVTDDGQIVNTTTGKVKSQSTLYDLFYKQKGSAQHQITEILENEGQETIERVNPA